MQKIANLKYMSSDSTGAASLGAPLPDPKPVLDIIDGMRLSKAVFTALELGVFDVMKEHALSIGECAEQLHCNEGALERLLDACTAAGLLEKCDGRYRNSALASVYVSRSSPRTLAGYMLYANRIHWRLWEHLEDAVTEGSARWSQTFGEKENIFDHFFVTDAAKETFLAAMHGMGTLSSPAVAAAFDLSSHRIAADLGGATGHLVASICERYPSIHGIVFDLPRVIAVTRKRLSAAGLEDRVSVIEGDFFNDPLPEADLYCLGRIFHDWNEEKIRALLRKMHSALPEGGAVLLAEVLLSDDKTGPLSGLLQSLNMLACTEGRERNLAEYRELFETEGFTDVRGVHTGKVVDAVYARKA